MAMARTTSQSRPEVAVGGGGVEHGDEEVELGEEAGEGRDAGERENEDGERRGRARGRGG